MKFLATIPFIPLLPALAACTPEPARPSADLSAPLPVFVRSNVRSNLELEALARGRLHVDRNGCLRIGGEEGAFVIWHHDSRLERQEDGHLKITDGYSGNSAYVGDDVAMGGGVQNRVPPASGARPDMPTNVTPPVPAACAAGEIWWAGRLMTEAERKKLPEY